MKKVLSTTLFLLMALAAWADELPTITVVYSGETATVTIPAGTGVTCASGTSSAVVLTETLATEDDGGTEIKYILSGTTTNGSFSLTACKPTIELNGVSLTHPSSAAFTITSDKRAKVYLVGTSSIQDGAGSAKGALWFTARPEFEGSGTLNITANGKHAIKCDKEIEIDCEGGAINILQTGTKGDGIHFGQDKLVTKKGKAIDDYCLLSGGTLTFTGVKGDIIDCGDYGRVNIDGGKIVYAISKSDGNGILATTGFTMTGGEIDATLTGAGSQAVKCSTFSMTGGTVNGTASGAGSRVIKTDGAFTMSGGSITAVLSGGNSADDHCTGIKVANSTTPADMTVTGGTLSFTMANDEAESFDCKGTFSITGAGKIELTGTKYAVNPTDFGCDMRAYVKVNLNGTDFGQYDYRKCQIGAYIGNTLCGGGTTTITPKGTYVYLPIYSNDNSSSVVNFRVQNYDDGTLTEYTAGNFCEFSNSGSLATPSSPFELDIHSLNELTIGDEVAYTRTVTNSFGTVVLPFAPTSHENVKFYTISNVGNDVLTLSEVTNPVANTPYLFQVVGQASDSYAMTLSAPATALAVPAGTPSNNMAGGLTMYGTYKQKSLDATAAVNDVYYISSNKFWHATGSLAVKPYRTWLEAPKTTSQVKAYTLAIGDEATGIAVVEDGEMKMYFGTIYDLQGQKVARPQSGRIYIVNGKKMLF